jgi:hypothetical protein
MRHRFLLGGVGVCHVASMGRGNGFLYAANKKRLQLGSLNQDKILSS